MKKIILISLIGLFFASCQNEYTQIESKKLDSIITHVKNLKFKFDSLGKDSVSKKLEIIVSNEKYFFDNKIDLAKDSALLKSMMVYGRILKSYKKYLKVYNIKQAEIDLSISQFTDLKKDFLSDKLNKEDYMKYFSEEDSILIRLNESVKFYIDDIISANKFYIEENPKIEEFIKRSLNN